MVGGTDHTLNLAVFPSGQRKKNPNKTKHPTHPSSPPASSPWSFWQISDEKAHEQHPRLSPIELHTPSRLTPASDAAACRMLNKGQTGKGAECTGPPRHDLGGKGLLSSLPAHCKDSRGFVKCSSAGCMGYK